LDAQIDAIDPTRSWHPRDMGWLRVVLASTIAMPLAGCVDPPSWEGPFDLGQTWGEDEFRSFEDESRLQLHYIVPCASSPWSFEFRVRSTEPWADPDYVGPDDTKARVEMTIERDGVGVGQDWDDGDVLVRHPVFSDVSGGADEAWFSWALPWDGGTVEGSTVDVAGVFVSPDGDVFEFEYALDVVADDSAP
jgi:hypothetical protein